MERRRHRPVALLALLALLASCAPAITDPREAELASVVAQADLAMIRSRPRELMLGKYARMARSLFDFYRGTFPLFLHDLHDGTRPIARSRFTGTNLLAVSIGDSHPENFGAMVAADGTFAIEPNDFDAADRWPWLWDLRRLTVGLVVATRASNADDSAARDAAVRREADIAHAAAQAYAETMSALAAGTPPVRATTDDGSTVIADLFRRGARDLAARAELTADTVASASGRRFVRGTPDPTDPETVLEDLPPNAYAALPAAIARYRETLASPPAADELVLLDAVRIVGSGVASWPKVRVLLLVRGPTDDAADDLILELKELSDSGASGWLPPGVPAATVGDRVRALTFAAWARPDADPWWGVTTWVGLPVQIRTESEAFKGVKVTRLVGDRGTPDALIALARYLGALLARVHAAPFRGTASPAAAIAHAIAVDPAGFADEQAEVSVEHANLVVADYARFRDALGKLGPTLGVHVAASDAPSPDLTALYGTPGPVQPW